MPLSGSAFWAVVVPVGDRANLISNPSYERGTQGWGTVQAGTIGTTSAFQQFGAWSGSVAPTSNGTTGAVSPSFTAGNGTIYTASAYIRGANGIPYRFGVGDANGASMVGSTTFTGGGTWHRYSFTWTEPAGATRALAVKKDASADTTAFYIDGVQVEVASLTTYIDGDGDGCYWLGLPHQSQSVRSGTYRGGGSIVALADLGLRPNEHMGIGMPPQEVTSQSYALQPGAEYQRSRASERPFTLSFEPIMGTTMKDYHATRRTIINTLKPDLLDPQQPVRFWYTGGQGTVQIDAVYQSGLELNSMNGPMAETGGIKFIAPDPYWYATTQEGTALAPRVNLGSTNFVAKRDAYGRWGTMGIAGTSVHAQVIAMAMLNGTLFVGGALGSAGGTLARNIAMYLPSANTWGTLTGGTLNGTVRAITVSPAGSLFVGGEFTLAGGTDSRRVAQWNGAWGSLTGGTVSSTARALKFNQLGSLFVGGDFTSVAGTSTFHVAFWNGISAWGTLTGGTVNNLVADLAVDTTNRLYIGGAFGSAGGTVANGIASWKNGAFGTLAGGVALGGLIGPPPTVVRIAVAPDQRVYIGGHFGSAGIGSAQLVAAWNGVQFFPLGAGFGTIGGGIEEITGLLAENDGNVLVGGNNAGTNTGDIILPDQQATWNGYGFVPFDINLNGVGNIWSFVRAPDNTLYVGGNFTGTAYAAAVAQVYNSGIGDAYPTAVIRNAGATATRLYQLLNTSTGDALYFTNYTMQAGEEVTLITEPGQRSFTSSFQGNVFGRILGGSNIASFRLLSGTNFISLFSDSASVVASLYWTPRSDSVDGGTIY